MWFVVIDTGSFCQRRLVAGDCEGEVSDEDSRLFLGSRRWCTVAWQKAAPELVDLTWNLTEASREGQRSRGMHGVCAVDSAVIE